MVCHNHAHTKYQVATHSNTLHHTMSTFLSSHAVFSCSLFTLWSLKSEHFALKHGHSHLVVGAACNTGGRLCTRGTCGAACVVNRAGFVYTWPLIWPQQHHGSRLGGYNMATDVRRHCRFPMSKPQPSPHTTMCTHTMLQSHSTALLVCIQSNLHVRQFTSIVYYNYMIHLTWIVRTPLTVLVLRFACNNSRGDQKIKHWLIIP